MNSYAKYIETVIEQEPENKLLEASILYQKSFGTVPEMTYYKTLERMSKQGSLVHLTKGLYEQWPGNCNWLQTLQSKGFNNTNKQTG